MAWQVPKIDWTAADGVRNTDFNRIESNTQYLYETHGGVRKANTRVVGTSLAGHTVGQVDYLCDGVADEVQINQALTSLNVTNGGTVVLLEGSYSLAASVVLSKMGTVLRGMSTGTILTRAAIFDNMITVNATYSTIRDLRLNGVSSTYKTDNYVGIKSSAERLTVAGCLLINHGGAAINSNGMAVNITNNMFKNSAGTSSYDIKVSGYRPSVSLNYFDSSSSCVSFDNVYEGVIASNTMKASTYGTGVGLFLCEACTVTSNVITGFTYGIRCSGAQSSTDTVFMEANTFVGNACYNCTEGIYLGASRKNVIVGNTVKREDVFQPTDYTIHLLFAGDTIVTNNIIKGKAVVAEGDTVGNIIKDNIV